MYAIRSYYESLLVDNDGMVWIITDGNGFFSYNPQQNKFKKYNTGNGINSPSFNIICDIIAEDNRYLLLGVDQGGLVRFDKKTEQLTALLTDENSEYGLNNKGIWSFHKDKEGILWIGTSGGGVNYSIPGHEKFKLFRHNRITSYNVCYTKLLRPFSGLPSVIICTTCSCEQPLIQNLSVRLGPILFPSPFTPWQAMHPFSLNNFSPMAIISVSFMVEPPSACFNASFCAL